MAIKVLIRRSVPREKARELIPLLKKMRSLAANQPGYISGETLKSSDTPDTFLVISNWQSPDDWEKWLISKQRQEVQDTIDTLLGGNTAYEMFHYGFTE